MKFGPCIGKVEMGGETIILEVGDTKIKQSLTNSFLQDSFDFRKIYK